MIKIGIIGTAGRKKVPTEDDFKNMQLWLKNYININHNGKQLELVSGGAAWSDHLAIKYYLTNKSKNNKLTLYLPAKWNCNKYENSKTGNISNYYHNRFSKICHIDSLKDISLAIDEGATIHEYRSFFVRNTKIAHNVDILIAFTYSRNGHPDTGGTFDTWKKSYNKKRIHVCIDNINK